jgi:AmmeMemoRadiSam system protein B/AmmeMemoRadiSam system protein A
MRKFILSFTLTFLILNSSSPLAQGIRKPVYAGLFYEKNANVLSAQIDRFLQNVKISSPPPGEIKALIIPHAGYIYSGQIAAHSYKLAQGKDYETVIVIAPSHRYGFEGCSIYPQGGYQTPLGVAEIDQSLASKLSKASGYRFVPQAHREEHSVEVQIPFIQKTLPQAKIVPVVMGIPQKKTMLTLAKALAEVVPEKKVLIIASTDMSHFEPKKNANEIDSNTISLIQSLNTNTLIRKMERHENIMCGGCAVVAALLYAQKKGESKVQILKYGDSSLSGGSPSRVVGYLAAAIYLETQAVKFSLSSEEKKVLLRLARLAVDQFITEKKIIDYTTQNPNFLAKRGAFVTLKKRGRLRGCIGFIDPLFPLCQTVIRASIYAAYEDPRFPQVSPEELKDLSFEISVLSPLERIRDPRQIKIGKHGLIISKKGKKGLLLPQVATENHWSREEFLQQTCLKAGLNKDDWKNGAEITVFEAIVFH